MRPNLQFPADLVTFTEEIFNGKLQLLCSDLFLVSPINFNKFSSVSFKINYAKVQLLIEFKLSLGSYVLRAHYCHKFKAT